MPELRGSTWQERERERETEELRAREAGYRERLARQAELTLRLHTASEALQRVLREQPPTRAQLASTLHAVARISSLALETDRTSIWLFDDDAKHLHCSVRLLEQLERTSYAPESLRIDCASCPNYVAALARTHALAVEDVSTNPDTLELANYLREREIGALLDIPIQIPGALLGVVCHEHVGSTRKWLPEEIEFASNVGSLVALALETERRIRAEYAARGSEAKYRHLVESLPVTVYAFDLHTGGLEYVSPRAFELGGWAAEQWLAAGVEHWIERIHPEDRADVVARFDPGAVTGFPPELTYRVSLPDGRTRWVRDTCSLVRDNTGHSIALQGMLSDVTRQMEAELARKELERRHHFMLDHADVHAVMLDCEARVTFVNEYLCRMTGYAPEDLIKRNWFELTAPPAERERLQAEFAVGITRGHFEPRMESPLRTKTGGRRHVLWTNTLLRGTDGSIQGVSGLGVDLTQRLQLEAELQQQNKIDSLGRLAAGVAHDFNNLLAVMQREEQRLASLVRAAKIPHADEAQEAFADALTQATTLTHSLLVYGRKEDVRKEAVVLDELVQETLRLASSLAGPEIRIATALHSAGAAVLLDRGQLRQVLLNLVVNSADATRGSGGHIQITTHRELVDASTARRHRQTLGGEYAVVTVADDGCGMDERTLGRIFEPFFTTKAPGRGTGLGLAMCESIVDRAGGFIAVHSAKGEGTRFRVHLPIAQPVTPPTPEVIPHVTHSMTVSAQPREAHILVVDDVPGIRKLLVSRLREDHYRVYDAATVAAATQILATKPIDVLISDGSLPDGSGIVLARSVRSVQPQLKIVLISGSLEADDFFDATLLKPFDIEQLAQTVAQLLKRPSTRS